MILNFSFENRFPVMNIVFFFLEIQPGPTTCTAVSSTVVNSLSDDLLELIDDFLVDDSEPIVGVGNDCGSDNVERFDFGCCECPSSLLALLILALLGCDACLS